MNTPAMLWTGRILTGLFALFMLGASVAQNCCSSLWRRRRWRSLAGLPVMHS